MDAESPQRFTGRGIGGRLHTGFVAANRRAGSKASIPSKFETVLNPENHEADGFGRRSFRFDMAENALPGPGSYALFKPGLAETTKSSRSISRFGSAAFASSKKAGFSEDAPTVVLPGPGSYDTRVKTHQIPHNGGNHMFATPVSRRQVYRPDGSGPGPGAYEIDPNRRVPCSALSSQGPRHMAVPPTVCSFLTEKDTSTFGKDTHPSAAMRSTESRFRTAGAASKPDEGVGRRGFPPLFQLMTGYGAKAPAPALLGKVSGPATEGLSPSSPSPARQTAVGAEQKATRPSSMFADTILDRFGRPTVRYALSQAPDVGPGSYDVEVKRGKALVSSSWALSTVPREELKDRYQPPGPAYYNPDQQGMRTSFRTKNLQEWAA